jgi:RNA polymerase sigma-70 factor (ECF subfamily)
VHDKLLNERELLLRVADGDQRAYRILFDRYWDLMYANALHFTKSPEWAKDLAQEIFMKIWMMRDKLPAVERFEAYLFTVSKNMILDELRKLQHSPKHADFFETYFTATENEPAQLTELKDLEKDLHKAIDQLPLQMQTAFKLSRFEGLTHEQIARQMSISRVTSQNYIARAILNIRKYLASRQ